MKEEVEALNKLQLEKKSRQEQIDSLNEKIKTIQEAIDREVAQNAVIIEEKSKNYLSEKEKDIEEYRRQLSIQLNMLRAAARQKYASEIDECETLKAAQYEELARIQEQLDDYKKKRDVINEAIKQERMVNEQLEFYRIVLPQNVIDDIQILSNIKENLHFRENLDKLIYDGYVSKYAKEMIKRVLNGKDITGIYKVTNINTKEIYIGKSTDIGERWTNHIKSACGLAGVADSMFQRALKKYGIENFTWEVLEDCPKDKLTEREKYYISFYNTIEYGYNQRIG